MVSVDLLFDTNVVLELFLDLVDACKLLTTLTRWQDLSVFTPSTINNN